MSGAFLVAGILLLAAAGCKRDEVTHVRVAKSADPAPAPAAAVPVATAPARPPEPDAAQAAALGWTLPEGWKETHPGGMRFATLTPPGGRADVSVIVLPGAAGGELANVNRWRGQIGLAPLDEAAMAAARKVVRSKAGPISVYDFTAGSTRMVAALATVGTNTWFLKMAGDAAAVGAAAKDFTHLLESVRADGHSH